MAIVRVLVAVACAMVLTAPATAATARQDEYRPATMTMRYDVEGLTAAVHAPRTLVGVRPLVFLPRGSEVHALEFASRGCVVVLVDDPFALGGHRGLWRALGTGTGPLAERFGGFAGHFSAAEP
ncbi:hypothetical protein [Lentzea jiangxiensis]|uniref:Uncharacterized protein n=1 Tax=Lentzea jiangxiensis TaxID=641025 RepID=A0A1H0QCH3_9PSEU|nr:hypothetical protein [Lentzea jiangxiensis]SDP15024.1 hypothetical protein SAMN05421507_105414 [Lentzea jiangxiensis]